MRKRATGRRGRREGDGYERRKRRKRRRGKDTRKSVQLKEYEERPMKRERGGQ